MRHMYPGYGMGSGLWFGQLIGGLVFLALLVLLIVLLVRLVRGRGRGLHYVPPGGRGGEHAFRPPWGPDDPSRILDERLAKGDISIEDYHARKAALQQSPPGSV